MNTSKLIVSGASTVKDIAWPTWLTFIKKVYGLTDNDVVDVSAYGLGNEAIILKAINSALQEKNPYVIIQLTQIDKWDWYVEDQTTVSILNNEKHPISKLNKTDDFGFWSTGSHFPLMKEYFQENYFGLNYFAFKTLLMLSWFEMVCKKQNWQYLVLFDSPILSVTEKQLNTGELSKQECFQTKLIENPLCATAKESVNLDNIYLPGMMGLACLNDIPWFSKRHKNHPGSYVHYIFTKNIIVPRLAMTPQLDIESLESEALIFQKLVDNT